MFEIAQRTISRTNPEEDKSSVNIDFPMHAAAVYDKLLDTTLLDNLDRRRKKNDELLTEAAGAADVASTGMGTDGGRSGESAQIRALVLC